MTYPFSQKNALLQISLLLALTFSLFSCNNSTKVEDAKDVAEEHNDAKYNNTYKEKDAQFLVNAADINLQEIQLGKLAQQKSKTSIVVELAKMIEKSHQTSMAELTSLAASKIVTIPTSPSDNANLAYNTLNEKIGKDFDNSFCTLMVDGHTKAVTLFENTLTESVDDNIKAWITLTLPILRTHLDKAITCQKACEKIK